MHCYTAFRVPGSIHKMQSGLRLSTSSTPEIPVKKMKQERDLHTLLKFAVLQLSKPNTLNTESSFIVFDVSDGFLYFNSFGFEYFLYSMYSIRLVLPIYLILM